MLPSVAELTYFLEISKTLNFSHAAKNLNVSQPSLSRAMQNLEHTVGIDLFVRHKKGVALTPAGKRILLQVQPLIVNWRNTKLEALASHNEVEGNITIGCHPASGLFIHGIIAELLEAYPKLSIDIIHGAGDQLSQQVANLTIDIGITPNPTQIPDLVIKKLKTIHTTLWVGAGTRDIQNPLSNSTVLICNTHTPYYAEILKQCENINLYFNRTLNANSIKTIASLTENGCGIGLLPSCYAQALHPETLSPVLDAPVLNNDLCLIYRKECTSIKAVNTALDLIKNWVNTSTCLNQTPI